MIKNKEWTDLFDKLAGKDEWPGSILVVLCFIASFIGPFAVFLRTVLTTDPLKLSGYFWIVLGIAFIVIIEISYWMSNVKNPKNQELWEFVFERKGVAILDSLIILGAGFILAGLYFLVDYLSTYVAELGIILLVIVAVIGAGYIWYKVNELKYK